MYIPDLKLGRYSLKAVVENVIFYFLCYFRKWRLLQYLKNVNVKTVGDYNSIVIIAPHPDDEIIGIGGYVLKHIDVGNDIYIIYLTNGENSLKGIKPIKPKTVSENRIKLSEKVLSIMHVPSNNVERMFLSDGSVPHENDNQFQNVVCELMKILYKIKPDAVFVPHVLEGHSDHVAAFKLTNEAVKYGKFKCDFYGYWLWIWYLIPIKKIHEIDWKNTFRINIKSVYRKKHRLMDIYLKPDSEFGIPWSGLMPKQLLKAFNYPHEVITKIILDEDL